MGTSISRRADQGAKKGKYVLAFVDDGDNLHEVDAKDVVVVSPHGRYRMPELMNSSPRDALGADLVLTLACM
jgi:hypothetical protein